MRQQKDEELEQYKKEIERAARFNQKGGQAVEGSKLIVKKKVIATPAGTGTSTGM